MEQYRAYRTCPLCEATCGLEILLRGGRAVKVKGDKLDVFSHGYLCPKGAALHHLHYDPERLRTPLIKQNGRFVPADWDQAFAAVEAGLTPLLEKCGRDSVAVHLGNPCSHTMAGILALRPMLKALGSKNIFSSSSVDQLPKHVSSGLMFGHPMTIPVPDVDRTHFLVIIGANPLESNGSLATAPDWPGRLRALKKRGGKLVVIDPLQTRTAQLAHQHLAITPGTDALLLMAVVWVLFQEDLVSLPETAPYNGLEELRRACGRFSPEAVEARVGLAAGLIRQLARELAAAPSAAVYGRMGTSTVAFGATSSWLVDVVNALTGNLDRPGGAMFPTPAHMPLKRKPGGKGWRMGRWQSRVRGLPEVLGEMPVCTMCDEMETGGEGQVRALLTVASNPAMSLPNSTRVNKALAGLDFMVSVDWYVNATTRHAQVILPPTGPLSTAQYDFVFYGLSLRNVAHYSPPVIPKPESELDKWEILYKLAMIFQGQGAGGDVARMDDFLAAKLVEQVAGKPGSPLSGKQEEISQALSAYRGPERVLDIMLRTGAHGDGFGLNPPGLNLAKLAEQPHGVDLGPLQPRLPGILRTPSAKVELAPQPLLDDLPRLEALLDSPPSEGLLLVGRRHLRTNNYWMANLPTLVAGKPRSVLWMNPADAAPRGLANGSTVQVRSRVGALTVPVEITEKARQGVVSLPHGWGHDLEGVRMSVARAQGGVNSNQLSDDQAMDPVSTNAVLNGIPVEVEAAG